MRILPDQVGVSTLKAVSNRLWHLRANLMDDIVDQHGTVSSLAWFARNMPAYEKILADWGPIRTHFLTTTLSLINGCGYCAYGHAYAFQLHYFKNTDQLFPLSEHNMGELIGQDEATIVAGLTSARTEADLADEIPWLERTLAVEDSRAATDADEKRLLHLVNMFDWLNACGIAADTEPDEAHDPINKDTELRARYDEARAR